MLTVIKTNKRDRYYRFNCVGCRNVRFLSYIVDNSKEISYRTFTENVNKEDFEELKENYFSFYEKNAKKGLTFKNDWHITYYKSKTPKGKPVYFFVHSAIEYIFY